MTARHLYAKLKRQGMPIPPDLLLRFRAEKRLAGMSAVERVELGPAIRCRLERDLAKLGERDSH